MKLNWIKIQFSSTTSLQFEMNSNFCQFNDENELFWIFFNIIFCVSIADLVSLLPALLILLVNRKCQTTTQDTQLKHDEVFHHQNYVETEKFSVATKNDSSRWKSAVKTSSECWTRDTTRQCRKQHDEVESLKSFLTARYISSSQKNKHK